MPPTAAPVERTWNLADLFADRAAFERAREALTRDLVPAIERYAGTLTTSGSSLADALDAMC